MFKLRITGFRLNSTVAVFRVIYTTLNPNKIILIALPLSEIVSEVLLN